MNNKRLSFFISLIVSLVLLTFLSLERYDILIDVTNLLDKLHVPLASWSINFFDLLILAFIPLWTIPIYRRFKKINVGRIILTNILAFLILIATLVISYAIGDVCTKNPSVLLPDYIVFVPFDNYETFSLALGFFLTNIIFYVYHRLTSRQFKETLS